MTAQGSLVLERRRSRQHEAFQQMHAFKSSQTVAESSSEAPVQEQPEVSAPGTATTSESGAAPAGGAKASADKLSLLQAWRLPSLTCSARECLLLPAPMARRVASMLRMCDSQVHLAVAVTLLCLQRGLLRLTMLHILTRLLDLLPWMWWGTALALIAVSPLKLLLVRLALLHLVHVAALSHPALEWPWLKLAPLLVLTL